MSIVATPVRNTERAEVSKSWLWFVVALLAVNFGFDWWRRMDFEAEKHRLGATLSELREQILTELTGSRILSTSLEDRFGEVERLFSGIREIIAAIETQATAVAKAVNDESPGEVDAAVEVVSAEGPGLNRLLETPTEAMEAGFQGVAADPFLARRYGDLLDMRTWEPAAILKDVEGELGLQLPDEQKELVKLEIEYFRHVGHVAYSRFQAEKQSRLADRILAREYDMPNEDGVFVDLDLPPGEIFASATIGYRRFAWERSKYPEMYRWNCLFKYVPLAMLERLRTIFNKGGL